MDSSTRIKRVFIGWDRPLLHALRDFILDQSATPGDLGSMSVVLPGARAGRRLLELLTPPGGAVIPPRILTLGAWAALGLPVAGAPAGPLARLAAWKAALGKLDESAREAVVRIQGRPQRRARRSPLDRRRPPHRRLPCRAERRGDALRGHCAAGARGAGFHRRRALAGPRRGAAPLRGRTAYGGARRRRSGAHRLPGAQSAGPGGARRQWGGHGGSRGDQRDERRGAARGRGRRRPVRCARRRAGRRSAPVRRTRVRHSRCVGERSHRSDR